MYRSVVPHCLQGCVLSFLRSQPRLTPTQALNAIHLGSTETRLFPEVFLNSPTMSVPSIMQGTQNPVPFSFSQNALLFGQLFHLLLHPICRSDISLSPLNYWHFLELCPLSQLHPRMSPACPCCCIPKVIAWVPPSSCLPEWQHLPPTFLSCSRLHPSPTRLLIIPQMQPGPSVCGKICCITSSLP